jgi:hypothetical protein
MQILPKGSSREELRSKGQFWTPDWVAQAMVAYVLQNENDALFDPAVGTGAFFKAARRLGSKVQFLGYELDARALQDARNQGLSDSDLSQIQNTDFLDHPPEQLQSAIIANPPYIRHHRLESQVKEQLNSWARKLIGYPLDARAGLHVYFLLRLLTLLKPGGRLAIIVPADVCEGVFAKGLWAWISRAYQLEATVTFTPEANPFDGVDTNPIILLFRNAQPKGTLLWARCFNKGEDFKHWIQSGFTQTVSGLEIQTRNLDEAIRTGLSRPRSTDSGHQPTLGDWAKAMRGIATGANSFFLLRDDQVQSLGLPLAFVRPAIARVRDVTGGILDKDLLEQIRRSGRPTWLFSVDGRPLGQFPRTVQTYLEYGEQQGLPSRPLISTRRPWYRMETRAVPPLLFAYLGRRSQRFILNKVEALPLTGFLAIYPRLSDHDSVKRLWQLLNHPETLENLALVSKSYGGGALKAEPRALERLPLPSHLLSKFGFSLANRAEQPSLL